MEMEKMTKKELYEIAQQYNIPGRSKMSKNELILAIENIKTEELTEKSAAEAEKGTSGTAKDIPKEEKEAEPEIALPERYNVDTLVLLPINPSKALAFWEVSKAVLEKYAGELNLSELKLVLSFYASRENSSHEERITSSYVHDIGNYYIDDARLDDSIVWAELDVPSTNGKRINLLTSAKVKMPSDKISIDSSIEYMQINEKEEKLIKYSAAGEIVVGSGEFVHRRMKMFSSFNNANWGQQ